MNVHVCVGRYKVHVHIVNSFTAMCYKNCEFIATAISVFTFACRYSSGVCIIPTHPIHSCLLITIKKISFSTAEQHNIQHLSPNLNYEKHGVMMAV